MGEGERLLKLKRNSTTTQQQMPLQRTPTPCITGQRNPETRSYTLGSIESYLGCGRGCAGLWALKFWERLLTVVDSDLEGVLT